MLFEAKSQKLSAVWLSGRVIEGKKIIRMTFGLLAEWLSRRIKFGLSRFTIALGGYKLHLNYKNDPTKMKGVQGCADLNYHEFDRISYTSRVRTCGLPSHVCPAEGGGQ